MSIRRRLEALEGRIPPPRAPSPARERLREHLDRYAAYRRGDMPEGERPAFEEVHATLVRRIEELREEGRPWAT